jgi:hypothetical protein
LRRECGGADKVLERGEKIELLVDKTEVLDQHAFKFKKQSRQLKRSMWWKNAKLMILIIIFVLVSRCAPGCETNVRFCRRLFMLSWLLHGEHGIVASLPDVSLRSGGLALPNC